MNNYHYYQILNLDNHKRNFFFLYFVKYSMHYIITIKLKIKNLSGHMSQTKVDNYVMIPT